MSLQLLNVLSGITLPLMLIENNPGELGHIFSPQMVRL